VSHGLAGGLSGPSGRLLPFGGDRYVHVPQFRQAKARDAPSRQDHRGAAERAQSPEAVRLQRAAGLQARQQRHDASRSQLRPDQTTRGVAHAGQRSAAPVVWQQHRVQAGQQLVPGDLLGRRVHEDLSAHSAEQWRKRKPLEQTVGGLQSERGRHAILPGHDRPEHLGHREPPAGVLGYHPGAADLPIPGPGHGRVQPRFVAGRLLPCGAEQPVQGV